MKISQSTFSVLLLLLTTAVLAPVASAVSAPIVTPPSASTPSAKLISQAGVIRLGDSGSAVGQLQEDLAILGYFSGPNTAYFGSVTEDAVIRFQRGVGLAADGIVGFGTSEAIRQRLGTGEVPVRPPTLLRLGDSGDGVVALQDALRRVGYFSGSSTGYFGPVTENAVRTFQFSSGLLEDGIAGPSVFDALGI